jgi:hypothetical protein
MQASTRPNNAHSGMRIKTHFFFVQRREERPSGAPWLPVRFVCSLRSSRPRFLTHMMPSPFSATPSAPLSQPPSLSSPGRTLHTPASSSLSIGSQRYIFPCALQQEHARTSHSLVRRGSSGDRRRGELESVAVISPLVVRL